MPIILERSLQAQIVIPMATSLAFGILFSTVVTLILVPLLYIILDDVSRSSSRFFNWWWQPKKTNDEDVKHPDVEQAVTTDYKKDYL